MYQFIYQPLPTRVVFGTASVSSLEREITAIDGRRALALSTPGRLSMVKSLIEQHAKTQCVGIFDGARMHVPVETAQAAREEALRLRADCLLAIGGGSTVGLAKAIALELGLPIIAVPTTYAGSEMTPIWGLTEGGVKRTGRDAKVLPKTVIYDPELLVGLPSSVSATSSINALAHCVEALYAHDANPIISMMAEEGIRAIADALVRVVQSPEDLDARSSTAYGAWLAGAALGAVGMALHHKLCHTLGGSFDLPHAEVHTIVLPHAAAYNASAAPEALARVARALGIAAKGSELAIAAQAPAAIFDLALAAGAPTKLADIGMKADDLDRAAELATRNPYHNPRPITREGVRELLEHAFHGHRPSSDIVLGS